MKRIMISCFSVFLMCGLLASAGFSQDVQQVLDKMLEAQGGRKVLEGVKDMTTSADLEIVMQGISGTGTMYSKEPDKSRIDMEFMGMVLTQAYDGKVAWMINPQAAVAEEMPEELADLFIKGSIGNGAFLDPKKFGLTYKLKDKEEIEGKEYLVLERVYEDGYTMTFYVDPESYLIYKTIAMTLDEMMAEVEEETIMTDYKKVDGVMLAHSIKILQEGEEVVYITVTDVTFNSGLEDSLFEMEK
jgi:outer membrane lipoprotein-sorting protein